MKEAFHRYGQFMTFDLTYNVIKDIQFIDTGQNVYRKKWALGFMLGKDNANRPIAFSIVLMNS